MASQNQRRIRALLKDYGALSIDELLARLTAAGQDPASKSPRITIRNAVQSDPLCQPDGNGRYVYLPTRLNGAAVRVRMEAGWWKTQRFLADGVAGALLQPPYEEYRDGSPPTQVALAGGPTVTVSRVPGGVFSGPDLRAPLAAPGPFWAWWTRVRTGGADALTFRCLDGEARAFSATPTQTAALDREAVGAHNRQLRDAAADILKRVDGMRAEELGRRLLARGLYHADPPPDDLGTVLLDGVAPFCVEAERVTYRPDLTPAFRRIFADRIAAEAAGGGGLLGRLLGRAQRASGRAGKVFVSRHLQEPPQHAYRLKVTLQWLPQVWRVIEILDNQSLDHLHLAIQGAFRWDNDHLYSFFMSGRRWDRLTEIACNYDGEAAPPAADEVAVGDLKPQPRQRFLYLFDYGDELLHQVEVLDVRPAPTRGTFPRVVERHGKVPPQYATWE